MSALQVTAQKVNDAVGQSGSYTGQVNVDSGLPHGKGTMAYSSSSSSSETQTMIQQYEGEWQQGYWHGQGICILQNGDVYQGEFVQHERHGNGEYTWKTTNNKQRMYQGLFHHNQRHGHGKYTWRTFDAEAENTEIEISVSTYVGMFDNGQRSGHGVYHSPNLKYTGDWRAGQYHGYGVLETPQTTYKGYFQQGQKHGRGVEISKDDDAAILHEGQWHLDRPITVSESSEERLRNNHSPKPQRNAHAKPRIRSTPQPHTIVLSHPEPVVDGQGREGMYKGIMQDNLPQGVGTIKYQQHPDFMLEYEGFWVQGMKHGFGRVTYMTGDSYQGEFVQNKKHGQGELKLADGRQFRGQFHQDLPHSTSGKEKFRVIYPKNDLYLGHYENGVRSGPGKFTWVDGGYYDGMWNDGLYSGSGELVTATTMYKGEFQHGSYHGAGTLTNLVNNNELVYEGQWKEGLPEDDDVISNMLLHIPQPPLDYDVAQLLPQTTPAAYDKPNDPSLSKTIMSGLSSLVITKPEQQAPQTASSPITSKSPQKKNSIPDVLDTSVCKAVVDMAVWDGQDNPGRYTGIVHIASQRPHGVGRMVYDDGNRVHEGFWEYGHRQGHGRCLFVNIGDFHEGSYVQNLRQGSGTYYWKDGRQFVGNYDKDERHGPGVFTYPNGDVYHGNFEYGQRSGFGTFTFHNKTCQYQGEWKLGMYSGAGTLKWQSIRETRSVGETGEHITRETCQNRYEGNFESGLFEDEGVEFENDAMLRQGLWSKGKFVQPAYISSDNDVPAETEAQEREVPAETGTQQGEVPAETEAQEREVPAETWTQKGEVPAETEAQEREVPAETWTQKGEVPAKTEAQEREGGVANDHAIKDELVEEEGQEDDTAQSDDEVSDENEAPQADTPFQERVFEGVCI
jgi:hypothetical protein